MKINIEFKVECGCGETLTIQETNSDSRNQILVVTPCKNCIQTLDDHKKEVKEQLNTTLMLMNTASKEMQIASEAIDEDIKKL